MVLYLKTYNIFMVNLTTSRNSAFLGLLLKVSKSHLLPNVIKVLIFKLIGFLYT